MCSSQYTRKSKLNFHSNQVLQYTLHTGALDRYLTTQCIIIIRVNWDKSVLNVTAVIYNPLDPLELRSFENNLLVINNLNTDCRWSLVSQDLSVQRSTLCLDVRKYWWLWTHWLEHPSTSPNGWLVEAGRYQAKRTISPSPILRPFTLYLENLSVCPVTWRPIILMHWNVVWC